MSTASNTGLHYTLGELRRCLVLLRANHGDHVVVQRLVNGLEQMEVDAADLPAPRFGTDVVPLSNQGLTRSWDDDHEGTGGHRESAESTLLGERADEAVEYLELAIRDYTDGTPVELVMMLARLKPRLSPAFAARHLPALGGAMREGRLLGRGLLWLVRFLVAHGRGDDVAVGLARLVARMGELDAHDRAEVVIARMWAAGAHPELVGEPPPVPTGVDRAPVDVVTRLRSVTAPTKPIGHELGEAVEDAERVLRKVHLTAEPTAEVGTALRTLLYLEKLDSAKSWCETLMSGRHGSYGFLPWRRELTMIRAEVALRMGDLGAAREHSRLALEEATPHAWGASIGMALGTLLQATTAMGKFDEAAEVLARRVPEHLYRARYGLHYLFAKGTHQLATRQLHSALNNFLCCGEMMVEWRLDSPGLLPWRTGAAEVYLRLGNQAKARELVDQQLALPTAGPSPSRGIALRVKAATVGLKPRFQLLQEAFDEVQGAGAMLEAARVLSDLSHAHYELGERDRARVTARRAWQVAKSCQAEPLCSELIPDQGHGPSGGSGESRGDAGPAALSDAERRVAGLAALGHTNREIANKLYVTTSTVEQHLTKAYRKLNVSRRKNLSAALAPVPQPQQACHSPEHRCVCHDTTRSRQYPHGRAARSRTAATRSDRSETG